MDVKELYENYDVHWWLDYNPHEPQYVKFTPNILSAGFKIVDVYHSFCNARQSLLFFDSKDYGELVDPEPDSEEVSILSLRSYFLLNALAYYNYCIDLSWQVGWFFYSRDPITNESYDIIHDNSKYTRASKQCNFEDLMYNLTLAKESKLKEIYKNFFNSILTSHLREKYNYIKHRGTFHFEGLGRQDKYLNFNINNKRVKKLSNDIIDIETLYKMLFKFDLLFKEYFESIIKIMPLDYIDNKYNGLDPIDFYFKNQKYFNYTTDR